MDEQAAPRKGNVLKVADAPFSSTPSANDIVASPASRGMGFSLVELMVVISVTAILLMVAVPVFSNLIAHNELAVATNAARGSLMFAREAAVVKGQPVSLCAGEPMTGCNGDWAAGEWLVFRDSNHSGNLDAGEAVLQHGVVPGAGKQVAVSGNGPLRSALVYMPLGHAERSSGAFGAGRLRLCVEQGVVPNARELVISASGRVRMQRVDLGGACPSL
ncbi:GspH/FimT family pseudopilin [Marinobacter daepoensis]|uniref:Type II secretion system protein H n=1 Tax=Marinobacter daepoensis TaxID=262077 RepID=A0ABS3BF81_9GAMM|nr:GspH/FimT family pseudopilin [Marinobacter daepoensis]MBN7770491.1 GspH/FimT family pseudopilin [Marinobacter daepoensis]MBY6080433.1 GspH/FimT family pseudopilin [Marinobacter daepoensis]